MSLADRLLAEAKPVTYNVRTDTGNGWEGPLIGVDAMCGGKVVGRLRGFKWMSDVWYIRVVVVHRLYRGRGIAAAMVREFANRIPKTAKIRVDVSNQAVKRVLSSVLGPPNFVSGSEPGNENDFDTWSEFQRGGKGKPYQSIAFSGLADSVLAEANWVLYHWTRLNAAAEIVKTGEFHMIFSGGTAAERNMNGDRHHYYLSTSRLPEGGYNMNMYKENDHAIFQLDGQRIAHNYAVKPVRYWPPDWTKDKKPSERRKSDENEDRILSNRNSMPLRMATALHLFIPPNYKVSGGFEWWKKDAVDYLTSQTKIPVFWYDDMAAFRHLNTRRCVKPPVVPTDADREPGYEWRDLDSQDIEGLAAWLEDPNDETVENRRRYYWDYANSAACSVHNAKSSHKPATREALLHLSRVLRRKKMTLAQAIKHAQGDPPTL